MCSVTAMRIEAIPTLDDGLTDIGIRKSNARFLKHETRRPERLHGNMLSKEAHEYQGDYRESPSQDWSDGLTALIGEQSEHPDTVSHDARQVHD